MTRFARAQGSKASNARVPEESTPWSEMKQQLLDGSSKGDNTTPPVQPVQSSTKKLEAFTSKSRGEWAEFDTPNKSKEKKKKKKMLLASTKEDSLHFINDNVEVKAKVKTPVGNVIENSTTKEAKKRNIDHGAAKVKNNKKKKFSSNNEPTKPTAQSGKLNNSDQSDKKIKKRRKPIEENKVLVVDGREIEIENFDGFPIKKEDAVRLRELKKKMLNQGIPKPDVNRAMKLERRRAEKVLSRERRKVCFHCRGSGHLMSECPALGDGSCTVCFKCGSTEHKSPECRVIQGNDYKFGQCFVCGEQGHIARQCPDNPRGLYPQGGGCRVCGDVTHLRKDCPQLADERRDNAITLSTASNSSALEALDEEVTTKATSQLTRKNKIIKF